MASLRGTLSFMTEGTLESTGNFLSKVGLVRRANADKTESAQRLDGQTVVITGGNRGIGKETTKQLAKRGARIIIGCRDAAEAKKACEEIQAEVPGAQLTVHKLDLASIESIHYFAQTLLDTERNLDILINNAGLIATTKRQTVDGQELNFGVNHLGHFLLTLLLVDRLKQSPLAKIISVGSAAHLYPSTINFDDLKFDTRWNYMEAYGQSKLAIILTGQELARRLPANVHSYVVDPGFVKTELFKEAPAMMSLPVLSALYKFTMTTAGAMAFRSVSQGASSTIYAAASARAEGETGLYYA